MASHPKTVRRREAALALIDESGLLLGPLVRRSWAPIGQPPILHQRARHREKVSVAAALWWPCRAHRLRLFTQTIRNGYFTKERVAEFLKKLIAETGERLTVVWDGGTMHKGDPIRELLTLHRGRVQLETLPPYGSELMPVEQLWTWLKYNRLSNFAPHNTTELETAIEGNLIVAKRSRRRLVNFIHASRLPVPRTLLF